MAEILISREIFEYLTRSNGTDISATQTPEGYLVEVNDPEVKRQLNVALKIMDEYEETLRILAR
jgi:hypothetical protein